MLVMMDGAYSTTSEQSQNGQGRTKESLQRRPSMFENDRVVQYSD